MSILNNLIHKTKKQEPSAKQTPPPSGGNTTKADGTVTKPESQNQPASEQAATAGGSLKKAQYFIEQIKSRRSVYALGKDQVISDEDLVNLIEAAVRESPSSFNSQSSRAVVLLGEDHDRYWEDIVLGSIKKVTDENGYNHAKGRIGGFKAAYGTVFFYEDQDTVKENQEKYAAYKDSFPLWSSHATGMAQVNTWTALELAGYGANLQHYNNLTHEALAAEYNIPSSWKLHAELVFGSLKAPAGDKTYMSNDDRFKIIGSK